MAEHGTRTRYKAGCHCTPCRAAEAIYRSRLRRQHARGRAPLGMLTSPVEARRRIRQLRLEGYTVERIAQLAGWRGRRLHWTARARIRLATLLRIRALARFAMLEGVDDEGEDDEHDRGSRSRAARG